jgi:hypothetical protein
MNLRGTGDSKAGFATASGPDAVRRRETGTGTNAVDGSTPLEQI